MQKFKGDAIEQKYIDSGSPIFDLLSMTKDEFFDGCYDAGPLGDLLHDIARSPLANAIDLAIFRGCFNTVYESFRHAGSPEAYLDVFRKIFGDDVEVTFTVPAPGKLNIDIVAQHLEESFFIARHVMHPFTYIFDDVIWYDPSPDSGNIVFQSVKGFKTQYELEQMLFEMVPAGIFTNITLTFGV